MRRAFWQIVYMATFGVAMLTALQLAALGHPWPALVLGFIAFAWIVAITVVNLFPHARP